VISLRFCESGASHCSPGLTPSSRTPQRAGLVGKRALCSACTDSLCCLLLLWLVSCSLAGILPAPSDHAVLACRCLEGLGNVLSARVPTLPPPVDIKPGPRRPAQSVSTCSLLWPSTAVVCRSVWVDHSMLLLRAHPLPVTALKSLRKRCSACLDACSR
jgi:hypothetical protein